MAEEKDRSAPNSVASSEIDEKYLGYGLALHAAIVAAFEPWLIARVGALVPAGVSEELRASISLVAARVDSRIRELAEADVDLPLSGPLERMRNETQTLSPLLDAAGVERPQRDPFDQQHRPDDWFELGPLTFLDLGEGVHEAGIAWGAAKAYAHQARRK